MLLNNQIPVGEYRHNYLRLGLLVGTLVLFVGHIIINQLAERGDNPVFPNTTLRAEETVLDDISPSNWVYRSLDAFNYLWQLAWLLYSLTFIYRRSTGGYLYLSPKTFTPTFYAVYTLAFLIQTIWLLFFHQTYIVWSWIVYLISFGLLLLALFIISNNLAINKKIYETEGLDRDFWCLRFLGQNGVAFFASVTAVRFVLAFDPFLQVQFHLSIANAGTICLILVALIASTFFFCANFHSTLVERCAYQFSPWIVFIIFLWGVVENNWIPKIPTRNNIIAAAELIATLASAMVALALFSMRYRASKIDPIA